MIDGGSESDSNISPVIMVENASIQAAQDSTSSAAAKVLPGLAIFHGWVYKHYFKVINEDSKNLRLHCTLAKDSRLPEIQLQISRSI